jgi:hypothetical protein
MKVCKKQIYSVEKEITKKLPKIVKSIVEVCFQNLNSNLFYTGITYHKNNLRHSNN